MIEEYLLNYGAVGLFCIYLIYDKQIMMKKITNVLEKLCAEVGRINGNL